MTVNVYHEQFRAEDVGKIFKRAFAERDNHARVRPPLTREIISMKEESIGD